MRSDFTEKYQDLNEKIVYYSNKRGLSVDKLREKLNCNNQRNDFLSIPWSGQRDAYPVCDIICFGNGTSGVFLTGQ